MITWTAFSGREIDASPLDLAERPKRIVACLNVWNDADALRITVPIWQRFVDVIIAVDGSYNHIGKALSTDGTREFLKSFGPRIELLDGAGLSQCEKRSMYLRAGKPGDMLFIIDADERVFEGQRLRSLPPLDVGWVQIQSPIYQRPYGQPRLIRWRPGLRYAGRHHWMYHNEAVLCTHQYGGPGYMHRTVDVTIQNQRHLGRSHARLQIKRANLSAQMAVEKALASMPRAKMSDESLGAREALYILQYTYRDDGLAPSRLHTAINRTTPHWSIFFKSRPGPFGVPQQYDARRSQMALASAFRAADIVHFHSMMSASKYTPTTVPAVFHHHGTLFRRNAKEYEREALRRNALVLLSNLELFSHTSGPAHYLPNVMPVARYRAVRAKFAGSHKGFRIGHSPSHPEKKGTETFMRVCRRLQKLGVEPVVMHGISHADALAQKATCNAFFDSFWLGMQCSGLEAASMQMPVIAGDPAVASRYRNWLGAVPYTFAETEEELEAVIRKLVEDPVYYAAERDRVASYVVEHHDESAVALQYLDLLDAKFHWRTSMRTTQRQKVAR